MRGLPTAKYLACGSLNSHTGELFIHLDVDAVGNLIVNDAIRGSV